MQYAESITLDGGEVAIILLVLFALLAAWIAIAVAGCFAARRTGRGGSPADAVTWAALAVAQFVPGLFGGPNRLLLLGMVALAAQFGFFARGRSGR